MAAISVIMTQEILQLLYTTAAEKVRGYVVDNVTNTDIWTHEHRRVI